jgi:hypothetical protein
MIDGLWEKANEVNEVGYKVHSAAMIVELVAADITDNAQSGALWAALEILLAHSDRLEKISNDIMQINREHEAVIATYELKKGKKK